MFTFKTFQGSKKDSEALPESNLPGKDKVAGHLKAAKPKPVRHHVYTKLSDISTDSKEPFNFYGVVIDASMPHPKGKCYRQILKVVDSTLHSKPGQVGNNSTSNPEQVSGCISVSFFSSMGQSLPIVKHVGDIIRVHRASVGMYKNYKTLSVNMGYSGSWVLFKGFANDESAEESKGHEGTVSGFFSPKKQQEDYRITPLLSSTKDFTFTKDDQQSIKSIREWQANYFKTDFNYEQTLFYSLNKVRELIMNEQSQMKSYKRFEGGAGAYQSLGPREFDIIVKVIGIHKSETPEKASRDKEIMTGGLQPTVRTVNTSNKEETLIEPTYRLTVCDTSQMSFDVYINQSLMPEPEGIKEGDVIRMRSLVASTHSDYKQVLVPTDHSNILLLTADFALYTKFHQQVFDQSNLMHTLDKAITGIDKSSPSSAVTTETTPSKFNQEEVMERAELCSSILNKYQTQFPKPIALKNLLEMPFASDPQSNLFRVQFQTVCIFPNNLLEICQLFCAQCKKNFSYKDTSSDKCQECQKQLEPVYMLQLLVTDESLSRDSQQLVRVLLYSMNRMCSNFFNGIAPTNLYLEKATRQILERFVQQICRFNAVIEAIVERVQVPALEGKTANCSDTKSGEQTCLRLVNCTLKRL